MQTRLGVYTSILDQNHWSRQFRHVCLSTKMENSATIQLKPAKWLHCWLWEMNREQTDQLYSLSAWSSQLSPVFLINSTIFLGKIALICTASRRCLPSEDAFIRASAEQLLVRRISILYCYLYLFGIFFISRSYLEDSSFISSVLFICWYLLMLK